MKCIDTICKALYPNFTLFYIVQGFWKKNIYQTNFPLANLQGEKTL